MKVPRISWASVGKVESAGRYMFRFGWVTITAEDIAIWSEYPEATFALYEVRGTEENNEYRLGSVVLKETPEGAPG